MQTSTLAGLGFSSLGELRAALSTSVVGFSHGLGCVVLLITGVLLFPVSFVFASTFFFSLAACALSSALVDGLSFCRHYVFSTSSDGSLTSSGMSARLPEVTLCFS